MIGLGQLIYEDAEENQDMFSILLLSTKLRKSSKTINTATHKVSKNVYIINLQHGNAVTVLVSNVPKE